MFINIITNAESGRERLFPISVIGSVLYNGKRSVTIYFVPNTNGKQKNHTYTYPSDEFAKEQYERIKNALEHKV